MTQRPRVFSNRRLVNLGIFSPHHWPWFRPHKRIDRAVYLALKRAGFRETIWQFVFEGQRGGLILPMNGGRTEIHVRFYDDVIEAELEIGRHYPSHFLRPRYQAESLVLRLIHGHLTIEEMRRAKKVFRPDRSNANASTLPGPVGPTFRQLAKVSLPLAAICVGTEALPLLLVSFLTVMVFVLLKTLPRLPESM